jgi:TolA-binding protein
MLNFDGLTDAVTNLTGTLILLVVLIFGITTQARNPAPSLVPPQPPAPKTPEGKPIGPLVEDVEALRMQIQRVDGQIRRLEGDLPRLEQRIEELRKDVEEVRQRGSGQDRPRLRVDRARSDENRSPC